ncbi:MAG: hypothetical protein COA96_16920 [SAR86 cluster bacterium]|uniref:Uncharacterized protein n=1 Tax=SAR86 cluster bacterium TaxID=2030880 RepID=A0A2A5AGT6_9GAMM|nr:MAG: hypothetical protein COA96_16920 [SAR86 cluster bacterium]
MEPKIIRPADRVVLAFDPSTRFTGYAVGVVRGTAVDLIEHGKIRADRSADKVMVRVRTMGLDSAALIERIKPDDIIVETPAKQMPMGTIKDKHGKPVTNVQGQALYGTAVGAVMMGVWNYQNRKGADAVRVVTTASDVWSRGKKKHQRAAVMEMAYPEYSRAADTKTFDMADAVGLMDWWNVMRLKELL